MPVESLACALPCCHNLGDLDETPFSKGSRITLIATGTIALLAGVLALAGVPGLNVLGKAGGGSCIGFGVLILIPPMLIKKVYRITHNTSTGIGHKNPLVFPEDILKSEESDDKALRDRIQRELQIDDLDARVRENGISNSLILFTLPLDFDGRGQRNEESAYQGLRLFYLTNQEILDLPLATLVTYNDRMRNLVSGRLSEMGGFTGSLQEESLGALLKYEGDKLLKLPQCHYLYLSTEQLTYLIPRLTLDEAVVDALFPDFDQNDHLSWIGIRTSHRIKEVEIPLLNSILPFVNGRILLHKILEHRGKEIDCHQVSDQQLEQLFSSWVFGDFFFELACEKVPIPLLNRYLHRLTGEQFKKIRKARLSLLDLSQLSPEKVKEFFHEDNSIFKDRTKRQLDHLSITALNSILTRLHPDDLELIPDAHLADALLDLRPLSEDLVNKMFPKGGFFTQSKLKLLKPHVLAQIRSKLPAE